jgi:hypothetical protein
MARFRFSRAALEVLRAGGAQRVARGLFAGLRRPAIVRRLGRAFGFAERTDLTPSLVIGEQARSAGASMSVRPPRPILPLAEIPINPGLDPTRMQGGRFEYEVDVPFFTRGGEELTSWRQRIVNEERLTQEELQSRVEEMMAEFRERSPDAFGGDVVDELPFVGFVSVIGAQRNI